MTAGYNYGKVSKVIVEAYDYNSPIFAVKILVCVSKPSISTPVVECLMQHSFKDFERFYPEKR